MKVQLREKISENNIKEVHEFFKDKLDKLKEARTIMKTRLSDIKNCTDSDVPLRAEFGTAHFYSVYSYVIELYETFDELLDFLKAVDDDLTNVELDLQKHRPTLEYMKTSMEMAKATFKEKK